MRYFMKNKVVKNCNVLSTKLKNKFKMNYNKFSYHRANPYAHLGYMPPTAHINRHPNQYAVQMPQGEEHLAKIGKRMFYQHHQSSNIQDLHLLQSPQRYPYENRIALDKSYERNMNTIDIEGASSSTLLSEGVRNKFRGRESLIKRQKQMNGISQIQHLQKLQKTEEERRRQIAYQQYLKNQKMNKLISKKELAMYDSQMQYNRDESDNRGKSLPHQMQYPRKEQKDDWKETSLNQALGEHQTKAGRVEQRQAYRSIDLGKIPQNPELGFQNNLRNKSSISSQMTKSQRIPSPENYRVPLVLDKKSLRRQNPTNLSTITTINTPNYQY